MSDGSQVLLGTSAYGRLSSARGVRVFAPGKPDQCELLLLDLLYYQHARLQPIRLAEGIGSMPVEFLDADRIVVRDGYPLGRSQPLTEDELNNLISRVEARIGRSATVLRLTQGPDGLHLVPRSEDKVILSDLRSLEFAAQVDWSGCTITSNNGHFELPSGAHAESFVRAGDMFFEPEFVSRAAEWVLPELDNPDLIVADTWTLNPLLFELKRRLEENPPHRSVDLLCFAAYPSVATVERLFDRVAERGRGGVVRAAFVMSVASSQRLLQNTQRLTQQFLGSKDRLKIVTLLDTSERGTEGAVCLRIPGITRHDPRPEHPCELCRSPAKSRVVPIDPVRYYPWVEGSVEPQMLTDTAARAHAAFWEVADRWDAVKVHYEDPVNHRHLPVYVDMAEILSRSLREGVRDPFHRRVLRSLWQAAPIADAVFLPKHRSTDSLHELARAAFGPEVAVRTVVEQEDGRVTCQDLPSAIAGARRILILDDALVHGRTLRKIHRFLQEEIKRVRTDDERNRPHDAYEISAFVVLARPAGGGTIDRLRASFRQAGERPTHLHSFVEVRMPVQRDDCPWCEEANSLKVLLESFRKGFTLPAALAGTVDPVEVATGRLQSLQGTEGLRTGLFWGAPSGLSSLPAEPQRLSPHSLFGEALKEAVAFAAVACAMHEIRLSKGGPSQRVAWNIPRILGAYHDPLLGSAFLRSARPEELRLLPRERDLNDALEEVSFDLSRGDIYVKDPMLAAELFWASALNKLPHGIRDNVVRLTRPVLQDRASDAWALAMLYERFSHGYDAPPGPSSEIGAV